MRAEQGAVPADRLSQSLDSGGAEPRPPPTRRRALGASSRQAPVGPYPGERGTVAVTDTVVERREARAQPMGAPRLSGRGCVWCALSALRSPRFEGAERGTTARPRRKEQGRRSFG